MEDHQRRNLTGRRRLPNILQRRQAGEMEGMETVQSHRDEDSQDVMDWGEKTKSMTDQGTKVGARAPESGVPEGITSLESCSGQVGGLYGCQDTASVPKICQGGVSRLDDGGGVQGDVQRGRQIKGD